MDRLKRERKTLMTDFLDNISLSRRSFIKASATTGAAVTVGSGLSFEPPFTICHSLQDFALNDTAGISLMQVDIDAIGIGGQGLSEV